MDTSVHGDWPLVAVAVVASAVLLYVMWVAWRSVRTPTRRW
jgi:hypothetical protein